MASNDSNIGEEVDTVVFVHGTGAADTSDEGSRWWQFNSEFESFTRSAIRAVADIGIPFHWSGSNLESQRRLAGIELLARLRSLESRGVSYHLIGHSHGGSVIFHALARSILERRPLSKLRSWSTVGTPFLTFEPKSLTIFQYLSLCISSLCIFILLSYDSTVSDWIAAASRIARQGQWHNLILPLIIFLALAFFTGISIGSTIIHAVRIARYQRDKRTCQNLRKIYGHSWLAIFHPQDEAINGLVSTLGPAPEIAPRLRSLEYLSKFVPYFGPNITRLLSRFSDEFAWLQIIRRAQGLDINGVQLVFAGTSPIQLFPGYTPINNDIAFKMSESANLNASQSASRFRSLLVNASIERNTTSILKSISTVPSFQELIHTSYFDQSEIREILVQHILANAESEKSSGSSIAKRPSLIEAEINLPSANMFRVYEAAKVLFLITFPSIILLLLGRSVYESRLAPSTDSFQTKVILSAVRQAPAIDDSDWTSAIGNVLVQLIRLGKITDPISEIRSLPKGQRPVEYPTEVLKHFVRNNDWNSFSIALSDMNNSNFENSSNSSKQIFLLSTALDSADYTSEKSISNLAKFVFPTLQNHAVKLMLSENDPKIVGRFYWFNYGYSLVAADRIADLEYLLNLGSLNSGSEIRSAIEHSKCALVSGARRLDKKRSYELQSFIEWRQFCSKALSTSDLRSEALHEIAKYRGINADVA